MCIVFFIASLLPNILSGLILVTIVTISTIILLSLIAIKLYKTSNRHPDRWPLKQWKPGKLPKENSKFPKTKHQKNINKQETIELPEMVDLNVEIEGSIDQEASLPDYHCVPVEDDSTQDSSSILEEEIKNLDKLIGQCDIENSNLIDQRSELKKKLCHEKNIPSDQCSVN